MRVMNIPCGPLNVNCYIVWEEGAKTCALVDPAGAEPVLQRLQELGLTCTHILLTHGHFDHTGGVAQIKRQTGAMVCIHEDDAFMLENETASLAAMLNMHVELTKADLLLKDGDTIEAGGLIFHVIHSPGHSPGGVCYLVEDIIFTGDTLFHLSVGRTDFPGSDTEALYRSILTALFPLPGDYKLYPGHLGESTLDFERENNPCVRQYRGLKW